MAGFGPSTSGKVIYHQLFNSETGNLTPNMHNFDQIRSFSVVLTKKFRPNTNGVQTSDLLACSSHGEGHLVSA